MGSCHVPGRRWRYGVEKDSFATLNFEFGTPLRRLLQFQVHDIRQCLYPDHLLLIVQILLKGSVNAQQPYGAARLDIGRSRTGLAGEKVQQPRFANQLAGASESDGLVVGSDLDLAAQNQPTGAYPVAAAANHFIRQVLGDGPELGARDRATDQRRIRAVLL